jgi:Glutamine synthetase
LVVASVLAGMHHGLTKEISPPEMIQESEVIDPEVTLPVKWQDSLDEFNQATILPQYFDEEFCRIFHHCRTCELDRFSSQISNKDFEWYLRSI